MTDESGTGVAFGEVVPTFRIFDVPKTREFYLDYLGFVSVFEYRFADDLPLFWAVRRGTFLLSLSEHHGDGTPGSLCTVVTNGIDAFAAELAAKRYRYLRPGVKRTPWGSRDLTVTDPFQNRITFSERSTAVGGS